MKVSWKKNKNLKPSVILNKVDQIKKLVEGKLSFSGFEHHDAITALESMIDFPPAAEDLDKYSLVKSTLWEVAKFPQSDPKVFINELDSNIRKSLAKRPNQYYVLTSLSIASLRTRHIELHGCVIKFYKKDFPRRFQGRSSLVEQYKPRGSSDSHGYTKVVIELKAKSESIAANKALRVLDLLRSLLAIHINSSAENVGNQWVPINKVRLGEFHTVHNADGEVYENTFWFEPIFTQSRVHYVNDPQIVVRNVRAIISKLSKFDKEYCSILCDGLLRYVRAFDEQNQNVAVLRAWGALESIAAPNESNCDSVTRRCSFLYEDYEYHKQILEHLREYRNRNVHAGQENTTAKNYGFQVQRYFIALLLFHIRQEGHFASIAEANRFLDLPTKKVSLESLKSLVDKSLKFRGYVA
ncbi:hypothetical protein [Vibrio injensis]|uniref:hypothetical protein n=1 Tax=Vibrio injensis TaxID=1307414 RepID=UPI00278C25B6|nr:hypothetical protein [Vibrio injensis]